MALLRATVARFPGLAVAFLALALLMKVWVPAGYMPVSAMGGLMLAPCSGTGPMAPATHMMPDMQHTGQHAGTQHTPADTSASHSEMPCTFSGLMAPMLPGADPLLLVAALAFIFVAALRFKTRRPGNRPLYLHPPAQAPPLHG